MVLLCQPIASVNWPIGELSVKDTTAKNLQEALEILKVRDIDIIISDWEMPLLNGVELLYHVRNHHRVKDIPFITMTVRGDRDCVVTALQHGVEPMGGGCCHKVR